MKVATFLLAAAVCLLLPGICFGQDKDYHARHEVYTPGYIDNFRLLALIAPPGLSTACALLKEQNFDAAKPVFARETQAHADDYAACIGFIQAAPEDRRALLASYEEQVADHPTAANRFKYGLVAFYVLGEDVQGGMSVTNKEIPFLENVTRFNLNSAYMATRDPLIGLIFTQSMWFTRGGPMGFVYDDMLRRLGGDTVYKAYVTARTRDWDAPLPPAPYPRLSPRDSIFFQWTIEKIRSGYGILSYTSVTTATGQIVQVLDKSNYTAAQIHAMDYFNRWIAAFRKEAQVPAA
jgi:hypothetical protein